MLTDAELDACAALMQEVAVRAMERIVSERPRADQVATKSWAADWVTETDLAVERLVREAIASASPTIASRARSSACRATTTRLRAG